MVGIDPGADTIQYIGDAALDAAGVGFAAPLWDMFFPPADPVFSQPQLAQLTALFTELFGQQYFQQNLDLLISSTTLCNEYANNPNPDLLADIQVQTENETQGLFSNGYTTARVYLTAAALHILTLKFALEAATDPKEKDAASANLAQAALDTLNQLLELELAYGEATGWPEYAAFKQATVLGNGILAAGATAVFGPTYVQQVQGLIGLVNDYAPARLGEIVQPPYMMLFAPYDANSTPCTWSARSAEYENTVYIYQCTTLPPGVPSNYFPLSDLATVSAFYPQPENPPTSVIYIASHASQLEAPTGYAQIYNDHGTGFDQDYAGFWTIPTGIGSFSATWDDATTPDASGRCMLIDATYYTLVELGSADWDDSGTGADEDCTIYLHPQFGDFGVYLIERSHSRPDPDTVNGLLMTAITGHPAYSAA